MSTKILIFTDSIDDSDKRQLGLYLREGWRVISMASFGNQLIVYMEKK